MKILAIGNSFSQDASRYIHQSAASQGMDVTIVNLYIGGCSLETHWHNAECNLPEYDYERNGEKTERKISITEALDEEAWDVVTVQQCSHDSGWMDSYEPFLTRLLEVIRAHAPGARIAMQETWAYEHDSDHSRFPRYNRSQAEMYDRLRFCYRTMARKHELLLLPCGEVIQRVRALPAFHVPTGGRSLCRDGFHMSYSYGRYLLSCVWLGCLCGLKATDNPFVPDGEEEVEEELLRQLRCTVDETLWEISQSQA